MFIWEDNDTYSPFTGDIPNVALNAGQGLACLIQNCFSFYIKSRIVTGEEITPIFKCRQVKADKRIGSGEDILHGQRLYAYRKNAALPWTTPQDCWVSPNAVGVVGTDYMFCGWALEDADNDEDTVLMEFDGTRPEIGS